MRNKKVYKGKTFVYHDEDEDEVIFIKEELERFEAVRAYLKSHPMKLGNPTAEIGHSVLVGPTKINDYMLKFYVLN